MKERLIITWYPITALLVCRVGGKEVGSAGCKQLDKKAMQIAKDWHQSLAYDWDKTIRSSDNTILFEEA